MRRVRYRSQASPRMDRRTILALSVGGVAVAGASVAGISLAGESDAETLSSKDDSPLVISVRDAKKGTLDVFSGNSKKTVTDKKLAAQLLKAAGR